MLKYVDLGLRGDGGRCLRGPGSAAHLRGITITSTIITIITIISSIITSNLTNTITIIIITIIIIVIIVIIIIVIVVAIARARPSTGARWRSSARRYTVLLDCDSIVQ